MLGPNRGGVGEGDTGRDMSAPLHIGQASGIKHRRPPLRDSQILTLLAPLGSNANMSHRRCLGAAC